MKLRNYIIAAAALLMLAACSQPQGKKVAVVYYSKTGNTQEVAEAIAETLNSLTDQKDANLFCAELISLTPANPYPEDFQATIEESKDECFQDLGRELTNAELKNLEKYDVIFLGYPVWFGTYAPPVKTFLAANNFLAGKKVVPFCTYGTGGRVSSVAKLAEVCPDAKIIDSYGLRDSRMDQAADEVSFFISTIAEKLLKECCCKDKAEGKECCKNADKKECCKDAEAKECCKDGEKKECCKDAETKECCKDAEKKECCGEKAEGKECCGKHQHADGEVCTDGCCDKEAWRDLTEEDLTIFNSAVEGFNRMPLEPVRVKNVALAGANRIYECEASTPFDNGKAKVQAYVLAPVGGGKPELTAVER